MNLSCRKFRGCNLSVGFGASTPFEHLDSPIPRVRKGARWVVVFMAIFMPVTFRHGLTSWVDHKQRAVERQLREVLARVEANLPTTPEHSEHGRSYRPV